MIYKKNSRWIHDTLCLLKESLINIHDKRRTFIVNLDQLQYAVGDLENFLKDFPQTPFEYVSRWEALQTSADILVDIAKTFAQERGKSDSSEVLSWSLQICSDIKSHTNDHDKYCHGLNCLIKTFYRLISQMKKKSSLSS